MKKTIIRKELQMSLKSKLVKVALVMTVMFFATVNIASAISGIGNSSCSPTLWSNVYGENANLTNRLLANNTFGNGSIIGSSSYACIMVTGTIQKIGIAELDGDYHLNVKLDSIYSGLLNNANINNASGDLVVEVICTYPSNKSTKYCGGNGTLSSQLALINSGLYIGEHAEFIGEYVTDVGGYNSTTKNWSGPMWNELHPITQINYIGPVTTIYNNSVVEKGIYNKSVHIVLKAVDDWSTINQTQYQSCWNVANFSKPYGCSNITAYDGNYISVTNEGYKTVKYRSVDNAGNIENWHLVNFTIDKTAPVIKVSNMVSNATGNLTYVDVSASVTDNLDPNPVVTNNAPAGDLFPIGTTNVTWVATDWANNTNSSIQSVTITTIKLVGDINGDNKITTSDALLYLRYAVGQDISPYNIDISYDVTCDGRITVADALLVLRKAVGQIVDLQC
jgi:hypothetical protein